MARCKICGAAHAACGGPTTVSPVDQKVTRREKSTMPLKKYRTSIRSGRSEVETIVKLTEAEAEKLGLEEYEPPKPKARRSGRSGAKGKTPANKQRTPAKDKQPAPPADDPESTGPATGDPVVDGDAAGDSTEHADGDGSDTDNSSDDSSEDDDADEDDSDESDGSES